uniref:Cellulase domain-containing protein n=1 Tax=Globodera pallida TaxID=36090 RepID=A0A183CG53_GLOPA
MLVSAFFLIILCTFFEVGEMTDLGQNAISAVQNSPQIRHNAFDQMATSSRQQPFRNELYGGTSSNVENEEIYPTQNTARNRGFKVGRGKGIKRQQQQPQRGPIGMAMLYIIMLVSMLVPQIPQNLMIQNNNKFMPIKPQIRAYGNGYECNFRYKMPANSNVKNVKIWGTMESTKRHMLLLVDKEIESCQTEELEEQGTVAYCDTKVRIEPEQLAQLQRMTVGEAIDAVFRGDAYDDGDAFRQQNLAASSAMPPPYGRLTVSGNKLIGQSGQIVQLTGMSLFWSQWNERFWNSMTVKKLKCDWHVNVIRAPLGVENAGGYLQNPLVELRQLRNVIDACIEWGVYVVVDWHYTSDREYTTKAVEFFTAIAQKYRGVPNLIYEGWNEAVSLSWSQMVPYHLKIIKAIRDNTDNVIICGTPSYDMSLGGPLANPIGEKNIMYTFHWYAADGGGNGNGGNGGDDQFLSRAKAAYSDGLPLFCTEYGLASGGENKALNKKQAQKWWQWMNDAKISHINWCIWDEQNNGNPIIKGTTPEELGFDYVLTEDGRIVKGMLLERNPESTCPL